MSLMLGVRAFAVETGQVAYAGGSLGLAQGTVGSFDLVSPGALVFKYAGAGAPAGEVAIEYKKISGFSYSTEVTHHLGVVPAIAVGLVRRRERKHFLTIRFADSTGTGQAVVFEIAKNDPPALLAVLHARAPQVCGAGASNCGVSQVNHPAAIVSDLPKASVPVAVSKTP
jgi:hypothetical protein